jgi:hypothetical protein
MALAIVAAMLIFSGVVGTPVASAAPTAVGQCNADTFPTGAGFEVTCDVIIVNTVTASGATSSVVTTIECLAAAGVAYPNCTTDPTPDGAVITVVRSTQLVNSVTQCNGVVTGGGSNVICNVEITNNIPVGTSTSGVTVNQCNNAATTTELCDPFPASSSGATVTQCNGSGGKGTYVGTYSVQCTAAGDASALPLSINQCNGTATGGGSSVTCTVTIANVFTPVTPPVTIPPVTIPPVTIPPVTIPPVTIPPVTIPPVTIPPVTIPPVTIPPVTIPPVTIPPVTIPPVTIPPVTIPPVTTPPVTIPPVTFPPVTTPPVTIPPVTALGSGGTPTASGSSGTSSSSGTGLSGSTGTGASPSVVLPAGAPQTGFGGAARSGDNALMIALGGAALFGAVAATGLAIRRRRSPAVLGDIDLDGDE